MPRQRFSYLLAPLGVVALTWLFLVSIASGTCGGGSEEGPILAITPTSGLTISGVGKELVATVENNGKGPLAITKESVSDTSKFEITGGIGGACVGETLVGGETCPLSIRCLAKGEASYTVKAVDNPGNTLTASIKLRCD